MSCETQEDRIIEFLKFLKHVFLNRKDDQMDRHRSYHILRYHRNCRSLRPFVRSGK